MELNVIVDEEKQFNVEKRCLFRLYYLSENQIELNLGNTEEYLKTCLTFFVRMPNIHLFKIVQ